MTVFGITQSMPPKTKEKNKSLETWIWDAACSIRGAKDAPKYKDFILPLIFTKRLKRRLFLIEIRSQIHHSLENLFLGLVQEKLLYG